MEKIDNSELSDDEYAGFHVGEQVTRGDRGVVYTIEGFYASHVEHLPDQRLAAAREPLATADPYYVRALLRTGKTEQRGYVRSLRKVGHPSLPTSR